MNEKSVNTGFFFTDGFMIKYTRIEWRLQYDKTNSNRY